jgi:hypothetical protein
VSLANLLKRKHQHRDPAVRLRAVKTLDDESILVQVACEDPDLDVRRRAVDRLKSDDALRSVAIQGQHLDARLKAVTQIDDERVLAEIMRERKNPDLMMACFEHIRSQEVLEAIARDRAYNVTARRIAINMFADRNLLADILKTVRQPALREAARERLGDAVETAEPEGHEDPDRHMDRILATYDPEVVAEMLGAFRDSPAAVRGLGVILARGDAASERAEEILGRMLKHATSDIRLEALAQLRPAATRVADELRTLGESDPDPRVRAAVREVLDEIEDQPEA